MSCDVFHIRGPLRIHQPDDEDAYSTMDLKSANKQDWKREYSSEICTFIYCMVPLSMASPVPRVLLTGGEARVALTA